MLSKPFKTTRRLMGAGDLSEFKVPVGKFSGKRLAEIPSTQLFNYCSFVVRRARENKKQLDGPMLELMIIAHAYLGRPFNQGE